MQRIISTVVIVFGISLLTACNGSPGSSDELPTATFGPAVQTRLAEANRPRATRTPVPETTATPTPQPTATHAPPTATPGSSGLSEPDPADDVLLLALLETGDLAGEWWDEGAFVYDSSDGNWTGDDGMLHSPGTDSYCGTAIDDPYVNQVSNLYGEDGLNWLLVQFVTLYPSEQHADLYLSQLITLLQQCNEYEEEYSGATETVSIHQLEFPEMGDRSAAFVMISVGSDYQVEAVLSAFRTGRTVTLLLHAGESAVSGPVEEWGTQEITLRAYDKVMSLREMIDALERPAPNVV
jgi:hypothetical protein